jgi:hypothetical protein
MVKIKLQL